MPQQPNPEHTSTPTIAFAPHAGDPTTLDTPCLVLGVFENGDLTTAAAHIDERCGGQLRRHIEAGDLTGKSAQTLLLFDLPGVSATRVLLLGLGQREAFTRATFDKAVAAATALLNGSGAQTAVFALPETPPHGLSRLETARALVLTARQQTYRYSATKADKNAPAKPLTHIGLWSSHADDQATLDAAIKQGTAMADGIALARQLSNLPGNLCTPSYLADQATALAGAYTALQTEILDENQMAELGMGALLSVSRGSREPAKLIVMHYRGGQADEQPVALVGKGLTFDAGGISLKPAAAMDEMKYDMCGGASVLGAMRAVCALRLPINLIGVVPASENLPDGAANKPGDIVTSLSGQTIEILNTDAEGRLILCDALSYCERFKPRWVIDIATLTGACVIALGKHPSGLFTRDEALAEAVLSAGEATGDRAWRMPLWDDYQEQLDSNFADMANVGGREGGAITAACFLSRYTKQYRWAHLDIAGVAWLGGKEKGATGRPVALLTQLLIDQAGTSN